MGDASVNLVRWNLPTPQVSWHLCEPPLPGRQGPGRAKVIGGLSWACNLCSSDNAIAKRYPHLSRMSFVKSEYQDRTGLWPAVTVCRNLGNTAVSGTLCSTLFVSGFHLWNRGNHALSSLYLLDSLYKLMGEFAEGFDFRRREPWNH